MPNKFKYNKTGTETNSIFKGNWAIDTTASNIGGGPSSVTELYHGADIPPGGYVMYSPEGAYVATTDSDLLLKVKDLGGDWSSVSAALTWASTDPTIIILNKAFDNIVTDGLVLNLDASNISSFVDSEPTVNYVPGSYAYGMYAYASGPVGATAQDQNGQVVPVNRYTIYQASNTARAAIYPDTNTTDYHTFSFKWKYNGTTTASPSMSISAAKGNPEGGANNNSFEYQTGNTISIGNNWYLSTYTFKFSSNPTGRCVLTFGIETGSNQSYLGETFDIYEAQFELKDHATPFVNGTRLQNTISYSLAGDNFATIYNDLQYVIDDISGGYFLSDGIDSALHSSDAPNLDLNIFTLEGWVWWNQHKNYGSLLVKGPGGSGGVFNYCFFFYQNSIVFGFGNGTSFNNVSISTPTINEWHHITGTFDGTALKFYLDGTLQASLDWAQSPYQNNNDLQIIQASYPIDGRVAAARIYNKALTAEEVTQNFNAQRNRFGI